MQITESTEQRDLMVRTVDSMVAEMESAIVDTDEKYAYVAEWTKRLKATTKIVTDFFAPALESAKKALDSVKAEKEQYTSRLSAAETAAKSKMTTYWTAKETKRLAEEKRKRDEETKRREDERLAAAQVLQDAGKDAKAEALLNTAIRIGKVETEAKAAPEIEGVSYRENWSAFVVDALQLACAVAHGTAPPDAMIPNMPVLNAIARNKRTAGIILPGVVGCVDKISVIR